MNALKGLSRGRSTRNGLGVRQSLVQMGGVQAIVMCVCVLIALTLPTSVKARDIHVAAPRGIGDVYGRDGLVAAIVAANSTREPDNIILEPGFYVLTRRNTLANGPTGLPNITSVITISAPFNSATFEQDVMIVRSAQAPFRIFHVSSGGALGLINISVEGGKVEGTDRGGGLFIRGRLTAIASSVSNSEAHDGGGIYNHDDGSGRPGAVVLGSSQVYQNLARFDSLGFGGGGGGGIHNRGTLTIMDSRIHDNTSGDGGGGGVSNWFDATATLENSAIYCNSTTGAGGQTGGGGIFNRRGGTLTLTNSTISHNTFSRNSRSGSPVGAHGVSCQFRERPDPRVGGAGNGFGGGINNQGTVFLENVTVTKNTVEVARGGGVSVSPGGLFNLRNTIIAGNDAGIVERVDDCTGTLTSFGFNLIGSNSDDCTLTSSINDQVPGGQNLIDAKLDDIDPFNGTHALKETSPAIDGGGRCLATDQRRFRRPVDGNADGLEACDIGAFEFNAVPDVTRTGPTRTIIVTHTNLDQDHRRGIVIGKDDIVLDCKGHKIEGVGRGAGIELKVRKGVTVRNCVVTNFNNGFNVEDSQLNIIVSNTVTNNRNDGFHIVRSASNVFDDNAAENNDDDGFDLNAASANFFRSNLARNNKGRGINLDLSLGSFFVTNTSNGNGDRGFKVSRGSRYNTFVGSTCNSFEESSHPNFFQGNSCTVVGMRPTEGF